MKTYILTIFLVLSFQISAQESHGDIAKFDKAWVDYNVYDKNNLHGMKIHAKFSVYGMKEKSCLLTIRIKDGDRILTSNNRSYQNSSGELAVFRKLKPSYDKTVYNDIELFLPYAEMGLPKGIHNLKIDIDFLYDDNDKFIHLTDYSFKYTKH